jgi:hypothetical protein
LTVDANDDASDASADVSRIPDESSLFSLSHSSLAILSKASREVPAGL